MPSNAHNSINTTWNWTTLPPKHEFSRAFQQYVDQSNLMNIEFKMLKNIVCTLA